MRKHIGRTRKEGNPVVSALKEAIFMTAALLGICILIAVATGPMVIGKRYFGDVGMVVGLVPGVFSLAFGAGVLDSSLAWLRERFGL